MKYVEQLHVQVLLNCHLAAVVQLAAFSYGIILLCMHVSTTNAVLLYWVTTFSKTYLPMPGTYMHNEIFSASVFLCDG